MPATFSGHLSAAPVLSRLLGLASAKPQCLHALLQAGDTESLTEDEAEPFEASSVAASSCPSSPLAAVTGAVPLSNEIISKLLAEMDVVEAKSYSPWPSRGLSSGTPDPNRLTCLGMCLSQNDLLPTALMLVLCLSHGW